MYSIKPFKLVFLGILPLQRGKKNSSIALYGGESGMGLKHANEAERLLERI